MKIDKSGINISIKDINFKTGVKIIKTKGRWNKKTKIKEVYGSSQNRKNGPSAKKVEHLYKIFKNYHKDFEQGVSTLAVWERVFTPIQVCSSTESDKPWDGLTGNHRYLAMMRLQKDFPDVDFQLRAIVENVSCKLGMRVLQGAENYSKVVETEKDTDTIEMELRDYIDLVTANPVAVNCPEFKHLDLFVDIKERYLDGHQQNDVKKELYDFIRKYVSASASEAEATKVVKDLFDTKGVKNNKPQQVHCLPSDEIYDTFGNKMAREKVKGKRVKFHLEGQNNDRGWYPTTESDSNTGQPDVNGWKYDIINAGRQQQTLSNAIKFKRKKLAGHFGAIVNIDRLNGVCVDGERAKIIKNVCTEVNTMPKQTPKSGFSLVYMDLVEDLLLAPQKTGANGDIYEDGFFRVPKDSKGRFISNSFPKEGWNKDNYKALGLEKVGNVYYYPEDSDE